MSPPKTMGTEETPYTLHIKWSPCESRKISDLLPLSDYKFAQHDVDWSYTSFELIDQRIGTLPRDNELQHG